MLIKLAERRQKREVPHQQQHPIYIQYKYTWSTHLMSFCVYIYSSSLSLSSRSPLYLCTYTNDKVEIIHKVNICKQKVREPNARENMRTGSGPIYVQYIYLYSTGYIYRADTRIYTHIDDDPRNLYTVKCVCGAAVATSTCKRLICLDFPMKSIKRYTMRG